MNQTKPGEATAQMSQPKSRYKLAVVAPTCFYYQVDMFRRLAAHPRIDLTVYFCSNESLLAKDVKEMYRSSEKWGDENELLYGYQHQVLPNRSPSPSYLKWPYGLMNFSIWKEIRENKPDVVILMSWMNMTWWFAILACFRYKIPFLYLTDANVQAEVHSSGWKRFLKRLLLEKCIFKLASGFLCAGTANKELYQFYGVSESKLVPFAYSWGYEAQLQAWEELEPQRQQLRAKQGIPDDSIVILYCGRLSEEKRPLDLIQAFQRLENKNKYLAIVGDGNLRPNLEDYVARNGIDSVSFLGFQNRSDINKFYATADVLVLPSQRETWGIVVNEALCFGLPVITSDQVGAARDLICNGENGFTYPAGDVGELTRRLQHIIELPEEERIKCGMKSQERIKQWIGRALDQSLDQYFDLLYPVVPEDKHA